MAFFALEFQSETSLFTVSGHAKMMKIIMLQVGRFVVRKLIPKHFDNVPETYPGGGGYRYQKRTRKWNELKMRNVGHNLPNVYTGTMRRNVLSSAKVRATQKRFSVTARASSLEPMRTDLRAQRTKELQAVSNREIAEIKALIKYLYLKGAKSPLFKQHLRQRAARRGR